MLTAKEARKIANSDLLQVMHLIRQTAYDGGLSTTLHYTLKEDTIKVLRDFGYDVKVREVPIYSDTPYGILGDEPNGYSKLTLISWNGN